MKTNTKLFFAGLISCLFFLNGCKKEDNENEQQDRKKHKFCYKYQGRPDIALTYGELTAMLYQYDKTKKSVLEEAHGREDTRVNFFKIEDLKAYLAYVEKLSKEKKIKLTGINFISAAYPEDYPDSIKRNHQTLIMMPATRVGDRDNVSFDPLKSERGKPITLAEILAKYNYPWTYDGQIKTGSSNEMRMGQQENKGGDELSSGANRAGISPPL